MGVSLENIKMVPRLPERLDRQGRRAQDRMGKKRLERAMSGVRARVRGLSDAELDGHMGWLAQWLDRREKEKVVIHSIRMRLRIEQGI